LIMEKTTEEKKAAVLAECERLCPKIDQVELIEDIAATVQRVLFESRPDDVWEFLMGGRYTIVWAGMDNIEYVRLYRLLGLEARELREELEAEKAANAKLVEALTEIKVAELGHFEGWEDLCDRISNIAETALEAHKKGASPNPFYPKLLAKLQRIERGEMTLQDYIAEVENKVKGGQKP